MTKTSNNEYSLFYLNSHAYAQWSACLTTFFKVLSIVFREVRSSGQSPIKKHGNNNDIKLFNAFKSRKRHDSFHHRKAGAKSIGLNKCLHMRDTVEKYLFFLTNVCKKKPSRRISIHISCSSALGENIT